MGASASSSRLAITATTNTTSPRDAGRNFERVKLEQREVARVGLEREVHEIARERDEAEHTVDGGVDEHAHLNGAVMPRR